MFFFIFQYSILNVEERERERLSKNIIKYHLFNVHHSRNILWKRKKGRRNRDKEETGINSIHQIWQVLKIKIFHQCVLPVFTCENTKEGYCQQIKDNTRNHRESHAVHLLQDKKRNRWLKRSTNNGPNVGFCRTHCQVERCTMENKD